MSPFELQLSRTEPSQTLTHLIHPQSSLEMHIARKLALLPQMAPCLKLGPFEGKELFQDYVDFKVQRLQSSKNRNLSTQKSTNPVAERVVHIHSSSTYPWS